MGKRVDELERQLADALRRIADLESRPTVVIQEYPVPLIPPYVPLPYFPSAIPWPGTIITNLSSVA